MSISAPQLVSALYESVTDPEKAQLFIEQYAVRLGASSGAVLVLTDFAAGRSDMIASAGVDPAYRKTYEEHYGAVNVYVERLRRMRAHPVVQPGEAICPEDELVKTEYYNDYMRPQRLHYSLGMAMSLDSGLHVHLGATRAKAAGPFGSQETAIAELIAAHLAPAMRIRQRLLQAHERTAALAQLADALPFGILFLGPRGNVLEANSCAAEMLRARDGLSVANGRLAAAIPAQTLSLQKLISRSIATSQGQGLSPGGALRISRPSSRRAYNVLVSPLRAAPSSAVLVIVVDPERDCGDLSRFCQLYGLTPAESRVCGLLLDGRSPKDIADQLRITLNTARTHLKRILAKTESNRQSELVRLALSSSPLHTLTRTEEIDRRHT